MQFCNSIEGLTQQLQNNLANPYKRRKRFKLDDSEQPSSPSPQNDDDVDDDMEIQNSDDEPDQQAQFQSSIVKESNLTNLPDDASGDALQLSLLELKQKQEEILRALENESSDSNSPANQDATSNNDTAINDKEESSTANDANKTSSVEMDKNDVIENVEQKENDAELDTLNITAVANAESTQTMNHMESSVLNTPSPSLTGHSRKAVFGTPLIQQVSPFSKLPTGEKWSVGVSDVIDFENLPDATGTYSKLTGIIDKVRTVIKRINDDNDDADVS